MKKSSVMLFGLAVLVPAWAQDAASARLAYQDRQALAEVPRLVQQFDVLVENQEQIAARLVKVESGSGESARSPSCARPSGATRTRCAARSWTTSRAA